VKLEVGRWEIEVRSEKFGRRVATDNRSLAVTCFEILYFFINQIAFESFPKQEIAKLFPFLEHVCFRQLLPMVVGQRVKIREVVLLGNFFHCGSDVVPGDVSHLQFVFNPDPAPVLDPMFSPGKTAGKTLLIQEVMIQQVHDNLVDCFWNHPHGTKLLYHLIMAALLIGTIVLQLLPGFGNSICFVWLHVSMITAQR
jgi:hypothetical protein